MSDITHQELLDAITGVKSSLKQELQTTKAGLQQELKATEERLISSFETAITDTVATAKQEIIDATRQQFEAVAGGMVTHKDLENLRIYAVHPAQSLG